MYVLRYHKKVIPGAFVVRTHRSDGKALDGGKKYVLCGLPLLYISTMPVPGGLNNSI